ncbi:3-dehydroquinate dehydratase [Rubritalea halochordaticola]|uniref:3-dehydroquinate dehydratase n=1 Tax=Rubritalea halochordaticola TaxID=714537 RepID=A0ABP9V1G8_9BACT
MSVQTSHPSMPDRPKTVGSIGDASLLDYPFNADECEILEFRLDSLVARLPKVKDTLIKLKTTQLQTLITARCESEGGTPGLTPEQRTQLLAALSPLATFVDVELANFQAMESAVTQARNNNALVIASFHDFKKTPSQDILRNKIRESIDQGADIAKIAVQLNSLEDMFSCAKLLQEGHPIAISMMGMGALGPTSRLLFAQLGSVLNYGYLGNKSTAPGQWPASLMSQAIRSTKPF